MQHLQDTYEAYISRQEGLQEILDVTSSPSWNQVMSSAPNGEAMDAGSVLERKGKQDEHTTSTQQNHHATNQNRLSNNRRRQHHNDPRGDYQQDI